MKAFPIVLSVVFAVAFLQCASSRPTAPASESGFDIVYQVLQHPRCMNCHPAGDAPLQGEQSLVHAQNVQRGVDGQGLFAMQCGACHQTQNMPGAHMPPGAPHWQMPHRQTPLVFEGRSPAQLAHQFGDRFQNGGRSPAQILEHITSDALVLWGWSPGEGRAPVPIPHADFVAAVKRWIDAGCPVPR
jgi:hypothetical protein